MRHLAVAGLLLLLGSTWPSGRAHADPAGPTDYRSVVDAVEPRTSGIEVRVLGGDAFLELTVAPGRTVTVTGYQGEPYLRVRSDGLVEQNRRSSTVALNRDRYGSHADPTADDAAEPEWEPLTDGGTVIWHDHRVHWMLTGRPAPTGPDGLVQTWQVHLEVDGAPVVVSGSLYRRDATVPVGVWVAVAAVAAAGSWRFAGSGRLAAVVAVAALTAALLATIDRASLPAAARPGWGALLVLAAGAGAGAAGVLAGRRWWAAPLLAGAGSAAVAATWLGRAQFERALLPGAAPDQLVRMTLAVLAGTGMVALVQGVLGTVRPPSEAVAGWT